MSEKKDHPVFIVLHDWTKTNKGNSTVAETHSKNKKKGKYKNEN